jgi:butyryl-CoA dehydrogenase
MDFSLSPEQLELQERATIAGLEFRDEAAKWDREDRVDYRRVLARMVELGFCGLTMPKEFGGQDGDALSYLIATAAIFRSSRSWIPNEPLFSTSGPGPALLMLGSDTLRQKYLPDIVQGAKSCAIALTEPNHGSDLTYLESTAEPHGGEWVVNGDKAFITGVLENELYATFVRFSGIPGAAGVGVVILERDMPGFTMDRGPEFVGDRGLPHGTMQMRNVVIPEENVIRGPGHFAEVMRSFNMERLHNTSASLGFAEAAYDEAAAYTSQRHAFGRPVIEFQATYHSLADMWVTIQAQRLLAYQAAASAVDGHFPQLLDVSAAKLFGNLAVVDITLKSIELHGGNGVTMDYPVQRIHRDVVSNIVAGGSPSILRNGIASQLFPDQRFRQTAPRANMG